MKAAVAMAVFAVAATGTTVRDPVGDVRTGPDITAVSVSHTATTVDIAVRFAHAPPLAVNARRGWVDMLIVGIDVPPRGLVRSANGWAGLDYYVGLHGRDHTALFMKAPPNKRPIIVGRPKVTVVGRTLRLSLRRSTLGNPAWVELAAAAGREGGAPEAGDGDEAPDHGVLHHRLR